MAVEVYVVLHLVGIPLHLHVPRARDRPHLLCQTLGYGGSTIQVIANHIHIYRRRPAHAATIVAARRYLQLLYLRESLQHSTDTVGHLIHRPLAILRLHELDVEVDDVGTHTPESCEYIISIGSPVVAGY